jgi:hypothetical protein
LRKFFISLLIFFLTCIVELSCLSFWLAAFFLAFSWPTALSIARTGEPAAGFTAVFVCVASLIVPLFTGTVFGIVLMMLNRRNTDD